MQLIQRSPTVFNDTSADRAMIDSLIKQGARVLDLLTSQVEEIKSIPWIAAGITEKSQRSLGNWVFIPWENLLIRLLKKETFLQVKSSRNLYLLSRHEQELYSKIKIGVAGMTVGAAIAKALVLETCGAYYKLADYDNISISNLNRLDAGVCDLNRLKVHLAAEKLYEINPYLSIDIYQDGITKKNVEEFFQKPKLDIVIEEIDDLAIKVLMRQQAKKSKVSLLMATALDSVVLIDYEAYGEEANVLPFHGALSSNELQGLSSASITKKAAGSKKIIPDTFFSKRLKASFAELGKSISAFPQLAAGTFLRAAATAFFVRQLVANRKKIHSGRYVINLESLLG